MTSANGDPLDGEARIGHILKQTRRKRGLSFDEVEQATKIRKRYAMLPDAVYAQGFLKTYANYLGLDGEALSRQLRSRRKPRREGGINYIPPSSDFEQPLINPGGVAGTEKRMVTTSAVVTLLVALLALAAVIGPLYLVGRGVQITSAKENTPPSPTAEQAPDGSRQEARDTADDGTPEPDLVSRTEDAIGEGTDAAAQADEPTAAGRHPAGVGNRARETCLATHPLRRCPGLRGDRPARLHADLRGGPSALHHERGRRGRYC